MCSFELSCSAVSEPLQPRGLQPPGSSVHGILQASILERVVMPSSKGSSLPSEPPGKTMNTGVGSLCLCWRRLLDNKEGQPIHPKGNQSRIFIEMTDAEAETPMLWPPDANKELTHWKRP